MSHFDKAESIATNTLLIPDIPKCFFGCDDAMLLLHDAFAEFGPIFTFVPMKGFRRIMIIYQETVHALKAKKDLDKHVVIYKDRVNDFPEIVTLSDPSSWSDTDYDVFLLRVYFGQHYTINIDPKSTSLQVPQFQRNLLISPPGSPFEGWEQIEEDAPNQAILASDLIHAAEISDYELDDDALELEPKPPKTISIVCSKGTETPEHVPSITVQDWDTHNIKTNQEINLDSKRKMFLPTPMPPPLQ